MGHKKDKQQLDHINKSLITYMNPQSAVAAEFRAIRNNIQYASGSVQIKSIIITSPSSGEGKTTAAVNLAVSKAQKGEKVLIIDANLQNPSIHDIFQAKVIPGLSDVLARHSTLKEAIFPTEIGKLDILPFGSLLYNSVEMLYSNVVDELIELATKQYECVIIDTAPLLDVLDTNTLASKCDGVILVLKGGKTQKEEAVKAKRSLEFFAKARIIGVILNKKGM